MTPPATLFHALLRPSMLQILRASGYQVTKPAVLDSLTDLAAQRPPTPPTTAATCALGLVDVRMALEDCGALGPDLPGDDPQGAQDFVDWFAGPRNAEIRRVALDGEDEATDWLLALKQKHSKTGEDSKFQGTLLGKCSEHGEILVEGGHFDTIQSWIDHMKKRGVMTPPPSPPQAEDQSDDDADSRPPSSGLSSIGDKEIHELGMSMNAGQVGTASGGGGGGSAMDVDKT
ncbi:hypothetical protein MAPG_03198 [Magnaporthiopsis poae ATCC 64411]|uniref:Bromodomain associated domain-containing protein n=1 Tax=Magnaporthiopsis poae (strain ATCC 64411 / 73-15) TaxID=644358 RepID=A0A0C4DTD4_MAGP6|nr:hypothetical protein MAPG_03198 [Magnaporthiopsis poae ATCC 64411]